MVGASNDFRKEWGTRSTAGSNEAAHLTHGSSSPKTEHTLAKGRRPSQILKLPPFSPFRYYPFPPGIQRGDTMAAMPLFFDV
jgi:hypothetical protein